MTSQAIGGLPTWLHMLAQVYPPHSVALVGAGNGTGPLVQWLQSHASQAGQAAPALPAVTLLEPHAPSMAQLAKRLAATQACTEWRLLPDLLAPEQGEHTYHQYTLAAENGLLPPEALHPLWPSLQLQSQEQATTVALAQLLPAGWLLLDCLPAADLLQGTRLPASTQLVLARVVLSNAAPAGSSLASVQALLAESGFKAVATFAERNSALGKALFVRDPKGLQDHIDQALAKAQALEADKAQLTGAKDQALAQVQQLAQEKAQALQRCDELAKAKADLQAQLTAETQAKQSVAAAKAEALKQCAEQLQDKDNLLKILNSEKSESLRIADELKGKLDLYKNPDKENKFNEKVLKKAWIQGRWEYLAKLDNSDLLIYENRVQMVLMALCGHQQLEDQDGVNRCSRLALAWGVHAEELQKHLGAGIRNTLGISDVMRGEMQKAVLNFSESLKIFDGNQIEKIDIEERIFNQIKKIKNIDFENSMAEIKKYI